MNELFIKKDNINSSLLKNKEGKNMNMIIILIVVNKELKQATFMYQR